MKILTIIPARGGSKGIPQKNIKLLGGLPLIVYTIKSALEINFTTKIIVDTESEYIAAIAQKHGVNVPYLRPLHLAGDKTPTVEVVQNAIRWFKERNEEFDAVLLLQPTSPFRPKGLIDQGIQKFCKHNCDTLLSVLKVPHTYNPHWVFFENTYGQLQGAMGNNGIITRRQELPKAYYRDGSVYIAKTKMILDTNRLIGDRIEYIETDPEFYCNIDNIDDWARAESMVKHFSLPN